MITILLVGTLNPDHEHSDRNCSVPGMPPICSARKSTSSLTRAMPARSGRGNMLSEAGTTPRPAIGACDASALGDVDPTGLSLFLPTVRLLVG